MFAESQPGNWYPHKGLPKSNYWQELRYPTPFRNYVPLPQNLYFGKLEGPPRQSFQTHSIKESKEIKKVEERDASETVVEEKPDINDTKISATTKALSQMQRGAKKSKWTKQGGKISNKLKRQRTNERLLKILTPKNALILLNEIKSGCSYVTKEIPSQGSVSFTVQVKYGKDVLGTGQGLSKSQAKNLAAENAIKTLFSRAVKSIPERGRCFSEDEDDSSIFPWVSLAQFAMYKMFNEWQLQSSDLLPNGVQKFLNFAKNSKATPCVSQKKKEVPLNAENLHPTTVLYYLHPSLRCVEIERTSGPPSHVKMAFEFDGKQYCGVSTNKKEAKKEAAKHLLSTVYGLKYELSCDKPEEELILQKVANN